MKRKFYEIDDRSLKLHNNDGNDTIYDVMGKVNRTIEIKKRIVEEKREQLKNAENDLKEEEQYLKNLILFDKHTDEKKIYKNTKELKFLVRDFSYIFHCTKINAGMNILTSNIADFLKYDDIINLMMSCKNFYDTFKLARKNKIESMKRITIKKNNEIFKTYNFKMINYIKFEKNINNDVINSFIVKVINDKINNNVINEDIIVFILDNYRGLRFLKPHFKEMFVI